MKASSSRFLNRLVVVSALFILAMSSVRITHAQIVPTGSCQAELSPQPTFFGNKVQPAVCQQPGFPGGYGTGGYGEGRFVSFGCDENCHAGNCLDCDGERGRLLSGRACQILSGTRVFGEFLYLRPRNAEVAYAVPMDGAVLSPTGAVQVGPTALVDLDYNSGFRIGFSRILDDCARVTAQWSHYESHTDDQVSTQAPFLIRSLVTHPRGLNAASDGLNANAGYDVNFTLLDVAYENPFICCGRNHVEYYLGVRYGRIEQEFTSTIATSGTTQVDTVINFAGVGPRLGIFGKRNVGRVGLHFYGRGEASFLVGTFDASYTQRDTFASQSLVNTGWESGRIVSLLETELGIGWTGFSSRYRLTCGYLISGWFNAVKTDEYINAVQQNDPDHLGDLLTFNGLRIRAELRF